jgi:hypothetical protein
VWWAADFKPCGHIWLPPDQPRHEADRRAHREPGHHTTDCPMTMRRLLWRSLQEEGHFEKRGSRASRGTTPATRSSPTSLHGRKLRNGSVTAPQPSTIRCALSSWARAVRPQAHPSPEGSLRRHLLDRPDLQALLRPEAGVRCRLGRHARVATRDRRRHIREHRTCCVDAMTARPIRSPVTEGREHHPETRRSTAGSPVYRMAPTEAVGMSRSWPAPPLPCWPSPRCPRLGAWCPAGISQDGAPHVCQRSAGRPQAVGDGGTEGAVTVPQQHGHAAGAHRSPPPGPSSRHR